eukprot:jgi/Tetstr1/427706/TSEL_017831.t1
MTAAASLREIGVAPHLLARMTAAANLLEMASACGLQKLARAGRWRGVREVLTRTHRSTPAALRDEYDYQDRRVVVPLVSDDSVSFRAEPPGRGGRQWIRALRLQGALAAVMPRGDVGGRSDEQHRRAADGCAELILGDEVSRDSSVRSAMVATPQSAALRLRHAQCASMAAPGGCSMFNGRRAATRSPTCPHHWRSGVQAVLRRSCGKGSEALWTRSMAVVCGAGRYESDYQERYTELAAFQRQEGHCRVPYRYAANPELGKWVARRRQKYKKGKLRREEVAELDQLGFVWDILEEDWQNMYLQLKEFHQREGHCRVPQGYADNPVLGRWVQTQRTVRKEGRLSGGRLAELEKLDFEWDPYEADWQDKYAQLEEYRRREGHCRGRAVYADNPVLGAWINNQHHAWKKGKLSNERLAQLEELGFAWGGQEAAWQGRYSQLQEYRRREGHCRVPETYAANPVLGRWVRQQRAAYNKGNLSKKRVALLEELGFEWRVRETGHENRA